METYLTDNRPSHLFNKTTYELLHKTILDYTFIQALGFLAYASLFFLLSNYVIAYNMIKLVKILPKRMKKI